MDCSPPGSSVHGISQANLLEWVAIPFPGDLPKPGIPLDVLQVWIHMSAIAFKEKIKEKQKILFRILSFTFEDLTGEPPWTEEPDGLQFIGLQRVRHDWVTKHSTGITKSFILSQLGVNHHQIKAINFSSWKWTVLKGLGESEHKGLWYAKKGVKLSWILCKYIYFCYAKFLLEASVQFSHSVMSDSLWPHGLQHARPPCPSPTPRVYSNSCLLSRWCHPTILSFVVPFFSRLQSFPASGSFPVSQFFASGGQNIGVSALASVLPMNIQDWFPLGWTNWISLQSNGLFKIKKKISWSSTSNSKQNLFKTPKIFG